MSEKHKGEILIHCQTQAAWRRWLEANNQKHQAVWLKFAKKNSGRSSLSYDQAIEEALAYGWIDGLANKYDEAFYVQRFTPRKPNSVWSQINVDKALKLMADNLMKPSGLAAVEAAQKSGRWQAAYASSTSMTLPKDFMEALDQRPKAKAFYSSLNKANTYAIYFRLQTAKPGPLKQKKIAEIVERLEQERPFH